MVRSRVGPRSAGADPGPACYGRGGVEPTVTDANLVLGRIPESARFSALGELDVEARTRSALASEGVEARGVVEVVNAQMEQALRSISVERGVDPTSLALVAFGGAGPLHACELAEAYAIPVVIIPRRPGCCRRWACSPRPTGRRELVRSWPTPSDRHRTGKGPGGAGGGSIDATSHDRSVTGVSARTSLDCRYRGAESRAAGGIDRGLRGRASGAQRLHTARGRGRSGRVACSGRVAFAGDGRRGARLVGDQAGGTVDRAKGSHQG